MVPRPQVNIFVTNRFVAVPEVLGGERMLVEQLGVSGFYHVIVRCARAARRCPEAAPAVAAGGPRLTGRTRCVNWETQRSSASLAGRESMLLSDVC